MKVINKSSNLFTSMAVTVIMSALFSSLSSPAKAQAPGIVGIDHVGVNVPNLKQAVGFFHDMFGFEAVTKLGPFPMDADWKKNFHIHESSGDVTIVMVRAGNGASLELFEYKPSAGNNEQAYRDDLSANHVSLYTTNIQETKTFLESKGIKFLTNINAGGGDTEGEHWVYFETPWGSTIELNSYPEGKGYEKHNPSVKLWTAASAVELTNDVYTKADLKAFVSKQIQIWNSTNPASRSEKMKEVYQDNVSFFDHDGSVIGLIKVNERISRLQQKFPGFKFSLINIDNSNNVIRYYWNFGPTSDPKKISGMDLIILENGKIRSINVFLDHVPGSPKTKN